MRLSMNEEDPGYRVYRAVRKAGLRPVIRLNGHPIHAVHTADDRLGYVLALDKDDAGRYQLNARRTEVKRRQLRGKVEITLERRP